MYTRPAEWRKNKIIWLAWPFDGDLWQEHLKSAQEEFCALVKALDDEQLVIIFPDREELERAQGRFADNLRSSLKVIPYGDIWLRDTLPIFVKDEQGQSAAIIPNFNGWGDKYLFKADEDLSQRVAKYLQIPAIKSALVFEGGAIECDGQGTLVTTEQCLLNANRNPQWSKLQIEDEFRELFGATKVIWLDQGLKNDHTDGHIDTIARFLAPQKIAIMTPSSKSDPNADALLAIKQRLIEESDAQGKKFELIELPSPGAVLDASGQVMPASYLNFIIGDNTMVVPLYGSSYDEKAMNILAQHTDLKIIGLSAKAILSGGGAFHCISQEFYR